MYLYVRRVSELPEEKNKRMGMHVYTKLYFVNFVLLQEMNVCTCMFLSMCCNACK
jgi:hypothetical protein